MAPDADALLRHASGIRALLRGLLADDARIDDVLQDTWVTALSKGPRPGVPLGPWLKRVALNFARRLRRGEARRASRERAAARPDETAEVRFDLQREVVDELARLDEPYRSTLILRFFEGLSPKEIAERRGIPAATVRSHLKRGLDRIRERLDGGHGSRGAWGAAFLPSILTRRAAATGVIAMSAKTKLTLAAALLLAMLGGTAGVLAGRRASGSEEIARAPARHHGPPTPAADPAAATAPAEAERTLLLRGRIADAATTLPLAEVGVRIRVLGEEEALDLVTGADGQFEGTAPILSERALGSFFEMPSLFGDCLAVRVEGYAIRAAPEPVEKGKGVCDLGTIEVSRGVPASGRVVRSDGTGIAAATLLLAFETDFPPAYGFAAGRTHADGSFDLDDPVPVTGESPWTLMAVCAEGLGWHPLHVVPGRDRIDGIEIVVASAAALEVNTTDEEGKPLAGARVWLEPRFRPLHARPEWEEHRHDLWLGRNEDVEAIFSGMTGLDGRVAFARLPLPDPEARGGPRSPGYYDVVAWADGCTPAWQDGVAVHPSEKRSVTLKLLNKRLCAVSGKVVDEGDAPVAGAKLSGDGNAVTAADGGFRLEGLDPSIGKAVVIVEAPGYARLWQEVKLSRLSDVEGLVLRLRRALGITGRVVDEHGRPVPGVYLDILRTREQLRPVPEEVGADGRFVFPDASAGPWTLRVGPPRGDPAWEGWREIQVRGGDCDVEVVLHTRRLGATRLEARVVDAVTGKPVDPAHAMLLRGDSPYATEYAHPSSPERLSGAVRAERLHPGPWTLWVHVPGFSAARAEFTVAEGQADVRPEVRLGKPGRIVGRVTGARPGATVWTWPAQGSSPSREFETDGLFRGWAHVAEDGSFVIGNLVPIATKVSLGARGLLGEVTVDVPSGGEARVVITATPAAVLRFRSREPVPAGTETLEFHVAQGEADWACVMRLGGPTGEAVDLEHTLPAGRTRWKVVFESEGRVKTQEGAVDLVVGETTEVTVPIETER